MALCVIGHTMTHTAPFNKLHVAVLLDDTTLANGVGPQQAPLLDRDAELAALTELAAAARLHQGGIALLEGPAGIGRTALLERLAVNLAADGIRVLRAYGSLDERDFSFGIVRQLLEPVLIQVSPQERTELLSGAGGLALRALDPNAVNSDIDGEVCFATLHGTYWLLANLASRTPVLVLVDDAHWADRASLRWLAYLARRLRGLSVLIVLSQRTGEPPACDDAWSTITATPTCHTVPLRPLSRASILRLVSRALGAEAEEEFGAACHKVTGGNPLMLVGLLDMLARHKISPRAAEVDAIHWYGSRALSGMLQHRVHALPSTAQRLAQALAILGPGCDLDLIAASSGLDCAVAREAAHVLTEAGLMHDWPTLAFSHELVAETVISTMTAAERAQAHADAACLLFDTGAGVEQIANHLLETEPNGEAWRVTVLRQAARQALLRDAPNVAGPLLHRALQEPPTNPIDLSDVLDILARTEPWLNPRESVDAAIEAAVAFNEWENSSLYARAASVRAESLALGSRPLEACEVLERAAARIRDHDRDSALYLTAHRLAVAPSSLAAWRLVMTTPWATEPEPAGDSPGERSLLAIRAYLHALHGENTDAVRLANRALTRGAATDQTTQPFGAIAASALLYTDHLDEATAWLEAVITGSGETERITCSVINVLCLAEAHLRRGDLARATESAESAVELLPVLHRRHHEILLMARLVDAYVQQGRLDRAEEVLAEYPIQDADYGWVITRVLLNRGRLRLAQGRIKDGIADMVEAGRRLAVWGLDNPTIGNWRSLAALGHHALDQRDQARRLAYEELEIARASGRQRTLGISLRVAGVVMPGADGLALLREAVETLEESSANLELAYALVDLGTAENMAGASARARTVLRRGVELAERCSAAPLARRGHDELRRAGGRPRGNYLIGANALTASERRVAMLARQGYTNRQIAEQLHVGLRTVELHLSNAYRKLGINQRDELEHALR